MIIDMHTHIFPGKIAEKAVDAIGRFYDIPMQEKGVSDNLLEKEKEAGVDRMLVCSTATTKEQVQSINNFIARETAEHPEFIGVGSLLPDFEDPDAEIARMKEIGLVGIKLHPDFQKFRIDDPSAYPIYEAAQGKMPILFHMGDARYDYSEPKRLLKVLTDFPQLIAIAAHMGGYQAWNAAEDLPGYLGHPRMYIDTSSSLPFMSPARALMISYAHGTDRVLFGTDYPMWEPSEEMARFMKIPYSDKQRESIFHENAERLLGEK